MKLLLGAVIVLVVWLSWRNFSGLFGSGDDEQAQAAVEQFYEYEQQGDYGSAWELFHPEMQQRFNKAEYIQNRAHILMQDFGVNTFDVHIGSPTRIADWKMSADAAPIPLVYEFHVEESFHSEYGNFTINQPCFAAYESGKWKVLWSYEQTHAGSSQNTH
ncbi:hypothetical protein A8990_10387 [Paenibacillus taihuensis]|uniref:DUF4440 domain-containing protein n=2 Tax=Paenibacillus taihuensis TaxID=1156355 RepID=A0A3D9SD34_9BACL|nr:hypothetical protein A8990_10387 [Paenibacillus taihuensis]